MSDPSGRPRGDGAGGRIDPYAPFRPRWGHVVPRTMSIVVLVLFALAALTIPGEIWSLVDRLFLFVVGLGIAWFLHRLSLIVARPSPEGLFVRNLLTSRRLDWAEIVRVQFSGGMPWVVLDLADADTCAVMAIQRSDGERGRAGASRLAALVEHHGRTATGGVDG